MGESNIFNKLGTNDLLVFDIDGVLLDTTQSFPLAIQRALVHYAQLENLDNFNAPPLSELEKFKRISGFNNDWDLAEGALVYAIQRQIFAIPVDLLTFLLLIERQGGGLDGVRYWLDSIEGDRKKLVQKYYNSSLIRQLTQEHYAGIEYCKKLYGFEPEYVSTPGAVENEKVLIDTNLLENIPTHIGIYTGRNRTEMEVALDQIGLNTLEDKYLNYDDGVAVKPNPEPLYRMAKEVDAENIIFVGDSRDDWQTIRNFKQNYSDIRSEFIQIGPEKWRFDGQIYLYNEVNQFLCELISKLQEQEDSVKQ